MKQATTKKSAGRLPLREFSATLNCPITRAEGIVCKLLQYEGVVIEQILDIREQYRLLGMSIPARKVINISPKNFPLSHDTGMRSFPCSLVLQEERGKTTISAMLPAELVEMAHNMRLAEDAITSLFRKLHTIM